MTADFDPYYKWLAIPPGEQPPNHYRLLGVPLFTDDPDVIENAADQRTVHLRTFQLGERSELSQRVLNEIAAAKVCLLSPDKRAAYDVELRSQLAIQKSASQTYASSVPLPLTQPLGQPPAPATPRVSIGASAVGPTHAAGHKKQRRQKSLQIELAKIVAGSVAGLVLGYLVVCWIAPQADFLGLMSTGKGESVTREDPSTPRQKLPDQRPEMNSRFSQREKPKSDPPAKPLSLAPVEDDPPKELPPVVVPKKSNPPSPGADDLKQASAPQAQLESIGEIRTDAGVLSLAFTPDGKSLLVGGADHVIRQVDLESRAITDLAAATLPRNLHIETGGNLFFSGGVGEAVLVGSLKDPKQRYWLRSDGRQGALAVAPDGRRAMVGMVNGDLVFWDIPNRRITKTISPQPKYTRWGAPFAFSADGTMLLQGADFHDGISTLWDVETGQVIQKFAGGNRNAYSVDLLPDRPLALVSELNRLRVWNIDSGKQVTVITAGEEPNHVTALTHSPNGRFLIAGDQQIHIWETGTWKKISEIDNHTGPVSALAVSADGTMLASGGGEKDKTIRLWKLPVDNINVNASRQGTQSITD